MGRLESESSFYLGDSGFKSTQSHVELADRGFCASWTCHDFSPGFLRINLRFLIPFIESPSDLFSSSA